MMAIMAQKDTWIWPTARIPEPARVARWGSFGRPVLLFPSAGGDCDEIERVGIVASLATLIDAGRIKLYSVDGIAARSWLKGRGSAAYRSEVQNGFDAWISSELVPHVRRDCHEDEARLVVGGADFGAFNALASLCRHPDMFDAAICLSGHYDLASYVNGAIDANLYFSSPLHYLPGLGESAELSLLRERRVVLASGSGRYEDPAATTRVESLLRDKGIPHRTELWGSEYDHDSHTWRAMFDKYLPEFA